LTYPTSSIYFQCILLKLTPLPYIILILPSLTSTLFPYTTLFRSEQVIFFSIRNLTKLEKNVFQAQMYNTLNLIWDNLIQVGFNRSEEHTSELQSRFELVCRLLHEKKKYV